jgi:hypothetical protein
MNSKSKQSVKNKKLPQESSEASFQSNIEPDIPQTSKFPKIPELK